jgi:hypothetical protein
MVVTIQDLCSQLNGCTKANSEPERADAMGRVYAFLMKNVSVQQAEALLAEATAAGDLYLVEGGLEIFLLMEDYFSG